MQRCSPTAHLCVPLGRGVACLFFSLFVLVSWVVTGTSFKGGAAKGEGKQLPAHGAACAAADLRPLLEAAASQAEGGTTPHRRRGPGRLAAAHARRRGGPRRPAIQAGSDAGGKKSQSKSYYR